MVDIVERLRESSTGHGAFGEVENYNPLIIHIEAAEEIETLRRQLAEKDVEIGQLKGLKDAGLVDDSNNSEPEQQRGMACSVEMGQLLERGQDKEAGDFETKRVFLVDDFRGDTTQLVASIRALVDIDTEGCLVPHGIGGHARALLSSASIRLEAVAVALAKKDADIERLKGMVDEIQAARHGICRFTSR